MMEEKEAGFGDCDMDKKTYPVCKKLKSNDDHQNIKPASTSGLKRIVQFELPHGLHTDEEINSNTDDEIQRIIFLLKRDGDLFNFIHVEQLNRIKDMIKQCAAHKCGPEKASQSPILSQMDKILSDPETLEKIDKIVNNMIMTKQMAMDIPSFELLTPEQNSQKDCDNIVKNVVSDILNGEDEMEEFKLTFDLLSLLCPYDCGEPSDDVNFVSEHMSENKNLMRILPSLQQEVVDYCMFKLPEHEQSDFQQYGMARMETLFMFNESEYVICRDELLSLIYHQKVSTAVIRVWSIILNDMERKKRSEPIRFFFGVDQMIFFQNLIKPYNEGDIFGRKDVIQKQDLNLHNCLKSWVLKTVNSVDHLLEATMIFVPMLMEDHYFCVVINFNTKSVQYLDNRKYTTDDRQRFTDWASLMALKMRVYRSSICAGIVLHNLNEMHAAILDKVQWFKQKKSEVHLLATEKKTKEAEAKRIKLKK